MHPPHYYAEGALIAVLAYLAPMHAIGLGLLALIAVDTVTGMLAARKRGEAITSAGLRRGAGKCLWFAVTIIVAKVFSAFLVGLPYLAQIPVVPATALVLALVEVKSVNENLTYLMGFSPFKGLIDMVGSKNDQRKE